MSRVRVLALACIFSTPFAAAPSFAASQTTLLLKISSPVSWFGACVVNAGDVNGDGFEDILVGGAQEHGGAALYLGGPAADSIPDLLLPGPEGPATSPIYGFMVSGGGDLNGDGHSDFSVSDPGYFLGNGAVYIYFGGKVPDGIPDLILHEPDGYTSVFGPSVSMDSDFNGDGFDDVVVGSPGWEFVGEPCGGELPEPCGNDVHGRTYIYLGGPGLGDRPDITLSQPEPRREPYVWTRAFGMTVTSVGDFNGDRIQDILVAEPDGVTSTLHGRGALYLGSSSPDGIPDQFLNILSPSFQSISSAGDFNADEVADIVVSAPILSDNGTSATLGNAYVYFGSLPPKPDFPLPDLVLGGDTPSGFGIFVHGGRDLDGDGISDLMAGFPGRTFIYRGGAHPDAEPDVVLDCGSPQGLMIAPLAAADWNGDGVADPIVGAANGQANRPGSVYIFDVSSPLPARAFLRGEHRAVPLAQPGTLAIHVQPVGASYDNSAVDIATLRLQSTGTGSVSEIAPIVGKTVVIEDMDRDGVSELVVTFRTEDLGQLFSSIRGRQEVQASIAGRLSSRRRFQAPVTLTIVSSGGPELPSVRLSPNPLNPEGTLEFTIGAPGEVSLRLYDVAGRCVRTVLRSQTLALGRHRVPVAARDDHGAVLASGVYFYRLELPSGVERGRFVVAK